MLLVIRRLAVAVVFVLALAGCAGSERDAVTVGDLTISRAALTDLVVAVNQGGPDEIPATLSAEAFRGVANTWTRDAAISQALGEEGITMTDAEQTEIEARINEAIEGAQIGGLDADSGAFDALRRNLWVDSKSAELSESVSLRAQELLNSADVESRLGTVDEETSLIVAG